MPAAPSPRATSGEELTKANIETIAKIEQEAHSARSRSDLVADAIAGFCGSMGFVWVHILWFSAWLAVNALSIFPKAWRFDPPPFQILTLIVSLEAIFLSTFILISQNRQQRVADRRNHLDLQINLVSEQENSMLLTMMQELMTHLGMGPPQPEVVALQEAVDPEKVIEQIAEAIEATTNPNDS